MYLSSEENELYLVGYYYLIIIIIIIIQSTVLTVDLCSWRPVTASALNPQEPFGGFKQYVGGQFSATLLSEFQYFFVLTNFLTLWVLLLGHLSLVV